MVEYHVFPTHRGGVTGMLLGCGTRHFVFPTHVGVIRPLFCALKQFSKYYHARGGEPAMVCLRGALLRIHHARGVNRQLGNLDFFNLVFHTQVGVNVISC
jgi:hypothetical protein